MKSYKLTSYLAPNASKYTSADTHSLIDARYTQLNSNLFVNSRSSENHWLYQEMKSKERGGLPLGAPLTCPSSSFIENHTPNKRFISLHNPIHRYFSNKRHLIKDTNTSSLHSKIDTTNERNFHPSVQQTKCNKVAEGATEFEVCDVRWSEILRR